MQKNEFHKQLMGILKKIVGHLERDEKSSSKMITLAQWQLAVTIILFVVGTFLGSVLVFNLNLEKPAYDYSLSINPKEVMLNKSEQIDFEVTITNIGAKDINRLVIYSVDICRFEKDGYVCPNPVYINNKYLFCTGGNYSNQIGQPFNLGANQSCKLIATLYSPARYFDDKDKEVRLFVNMSSVNGLPDKSIRIEIY
ncbi:MAG: hypothetical protein WCW13_02845 [archaeon]|jgi:hypothetical protein